MRLFLAVIVLAAACTPLPAWTRGDTIGQVAVASTFLVDIHQTRRALDDPSLMELNPLLADGAFPPELYFLAVLGLHTAAMRVAPKWLRRPLLAATLGFQAWVVIDNAVIIARD